MRKILFILIVMSVALGCKNEKSEKTAAEETTEEIAVAYTSLGEKISDDLVLSKSEMAEKYQNLKLGDTLAIKFASEVKEVCQKKGCWMKLDMGDGDAMVRFKDYGFFMPKDIAGKEAIVAGKAYVEEMSVEDQKHYAEDGGATDEEIAAITQPKRTFVFEAHGVLLPEEEKQ